VGECLQCCSPPSLSHFLFLSYSLPLIRCSSPCAFLLLRICSHLLFSPPPISPLCFHSASPTCSLLTFSASLSLPFSSLPHRTWILPLLLVFHSSSTCCIVRATGDQQGSHWFEELPQALLPGSERQKDKQGLMQCQRKWRGVDGGNEEEQNTKAARESA